MNKNVTYKNKFNLTFCNMCAKRKVFIVKKLTASILTSLLIVSYSYPAFAQLDTEYDVVPPVSNAEEKVINQMPDIESPAAVPNNNVAQQMPKTLQGRVATAPRGTTFEAVINTSINSMTARVGDSLTASIDEALIIDSQTVIPAGSDLMGQITYVESAGRVGKNALMEIRFTSVKLPNGDRTPINAKIVTTDDSGVLRGGKKSNIVLKAVETSAGITAAGAVTGTAVGGLFTGISIAGGAVFGTAVGGLIGVGYAIYRKGKDIVLPSGTKLGITLEQPLTISNLQAQNTSY